MESLEAISPKGEPLGRRVLAILALRLSGSLLIAISILVTADIIGRFFFLKPIAGTQELCALMMPYIVFCAFGYALLTGAHVVVSLVTSRLPPRLQGVSGIIVHTIGLGVCAVLTYGTWQFFWESFVIREVMPSGSEFLIPYWVAKLGMLIGMAIFSGVFIVVQFPIFARLRAKEG